MFQMLSGLMQASSVFITIILSICLPFASTSFSADRWGITHADINTGESGDEDCGILEGTAKKKRGGTDDGHRSHVVSLKTFDDVHGVTVDCSPTPGAGLRNVTASSPSEAGAPAHINLPYGVFSFEIEGVEAGRPVTLHILIPKNTEVTGYYRKNPIRGTWEDVSITVDHHSVPGRSRLTIQFTNDALCESGPTGLRRADFGGPGMPITSVVKDISRVSTLSLRGALFMCFLLGICALVHLRRRRTFRGTGSGDTSWAGKRSDHGETKS